jgi:hypothetical protein
MAGAFFAGLASGVLLVVLFVMINASRPDRFIPQLIQLFQIMRMHLGFNCVVKAITGPHGWRIGVGCFACKKVTFIAVGAIEFKCESCGQPFRKTGNAEGGSGCSDVTVGTES